MTTAVRAPAPSVAVTPVASTPVDVEIHQWDPFQLMDRLDEEAIALELQGIAATELVYVVKSGSDEVTGLSKVGVDECCMVLVKQGSVIREKDIELQLLGEGEDREALFKVHAARYAVSPNGIEVQLDEVIGVKRQPLYYEAAPLTLDSTVPSKKHRGKTYRQLLEDRDGRDYLQWMAENFREPEIRQFVSRLLNGEAVEVQPGRRPNPHWYEQGAMKAARNARFRLIPAAVRAQVMAIAKEAGRVRSVDARGRSTAAGASSSSEPTDPPATAKQLALLDRLMQSSVWSEDERTAATNFAATATIRAMADRLDGTQAELARRKAGRKALEEIETRIATLAPNQQTWVRQRLDAGADPAELLAQITHAEQKTAASPAPAAAAHATASDGARGGPFSPSEKQIAFFKRLADSPVFTDEERQQALDWLATKATRQNIKAQIDWLKQQVETRWDDRTTAATQADDLPF